MAAGVALAWGAAAARLLPAQTTHPGDPALDVTRLRYGTLTYTLSLVKGDEEQVLGTVVDELLPIRSDDPVLRRVRTVRRGGTATVDSTLTELETLRPRWHFGVEAQRTVELEFADTRVLGDVVPRLGDVRQLDTTLAEAAFDATNWDLAVRALPLGEGEAAVLVLYDVDKGVHRLRVRVAERTVRGRTDVIHLVAEPGAGVEVHLWVDETTRTLLRMESQVGEDTVVRQVLRDR